jgi:hypothetical protein
MSVFEKVREEVLAEVMAERRTFASGYDRSLFVDAETQRRVDAAKPKKKAPAKKKAAKKK